MMITRRADRSVVDVRMDSVRLCELLSLKASMLSSGGGFEAITSSATHTAYAFHHKIDGLIDKRNEFNVYVEGRVNPLHRHAIQQAVVYTWNLTPYQTRDFVAYFAKNYQFTFVERGQLEVDIDGKLETRLTYFISSNGKYVNEDAFELTPRLGWLQDSMDKYDLPYYLLDGADRSVKPYDKLFALDLDGHVDPSSEDEIRVHVLSAFRMAYPGKFAFFFTIRNYSMLE